MKKERIKNWEKLYSAICGIKMVGAFNETKDLTPRYWKVLSMRFGLDDGIIYTLEKVAKELGVTKERIRQMEAKALEHCRNIR